MPRKPGGVIVENEIVKARVEFRETPQVEAQADWIAAEVWAVLDARGLNPRLEDIAQALDQVRFGYLLADEAQVSDRIVADLVAVLADVAAGRDQVTFSVDASLPPDLASAGDLLRSAVAARLIDVAVAADRLRSSHGTWFRDDVEASDRVAVAAAVPIPDCVGASDGGEIVNNNYVEAGYVELAYAGEVTIF